MRISGSTAALLKQIAATDQIVSPRLNQWLLRNPDNLVVSNETGDIIRTQITKQPRDRRASFSSSAAGHCYRKQVFDYLGAPGISSVNPRLRMIFENGTWVHLRLQALMLTAGIIEQIEVPLPWPAMRSMGTVDGVGYVPNNHPHVAWRGKEFGLEIKSANSFSYKQIEQAGPQRYLNQVHRYFLSGGFDLFVIFIENKDTQVWQEYVIEPDQAILDEQYAELEELNEAIETKTLPELIPQCARLQGNVFNECAYGGQAGICAKLRNTRWPSAPSR